MKLFCRIITFVLAMVLCFGVIACDSGKGENPEATTDGTTAAATTDTSAATTAPKCDECAYSSTIEKAAKTFEEGIMKYTCDVCKSNYTEPIPATKSIKILAVGNSFSINAMEYLYDICKSGGVEEIVLGNLYISGCTLDTHLSNINADKAAYEYYVNNSGKWTKVAGTKLSAALKQTDWDVITVQQSSANSGKASTFTALENIVKYLKKECTNKDVDIFWHMTWAYQSDFTNDMFANYNYNQKTMYDSIINAVKNDVANKSYIDGVIPAGTAIQNLRTSYFGDTVTRDGYHLNYEEGYYTAALEYLKELEKERLEVELEKLKTIPQPQEPQKPTLSFQKKEIIPLNPMQLVKSLLLWIIEIGLFVFLIFCFIKCKDINYVMLGVLGIPITMVLLIVFGIKIKKDDGISTYLSTKKENERRISYNQKHKAEIQEAKEIYNKELEEYNKAMSKYEVDLEKYNKEVGNKIEHIKYKLNDIDSYIRMERKKQAKKELEENEIYIKQCKYCMHRNKCRTKGEIFPCSAYIPD